MTSDLASRIQEAIGIPARNVRPLGGGCIGEVYRADLDDGARVVVKIDRANRARLDVEGYMLAYLAAHSALPVPAVRHAAPGLLVMDYVEGDSHFSHAAETHAAELLAALHDVRAPRFGLERDTLIGGLHQPNTPGDRWIDFFREHRLLYMAGEAMRGGALPHATFRRIEQFAGRLDEFLEEPDHPALLHGDVWTTNVLARGPRISAFLDPAVYYGHPEIELAFITLFSTFGRTFFERYDALRGIRPGFFEQRRDIYNCYPLLVHTRLFGASYLAGIESTLARLGF